MISLAVLILGLWLISDKKTLAAPQYKYAILLWLSSAISTQLTFGFTFGYLKTFEFLFNQILLFFSLPTVYKRWSVKKLS